VLLQLLSVRKIIDHCEERIKESAKGSRYFTVLAGESFDTDLMREAVVLSLQPAGA
jgi:hypothetical protein